LTNSLGNSSSSEGDRPSEESTEVVDDWLPMVQIDPDQRFDNGSINGSFKESGVDEHEDQPDDNNYDHHGHDSLDASGEHMSENQGVDSGAHSVGTRWDDFDNTAAFGNPQKQQQQHVDGSLSLGGRSGNVQSGGSKSWDQIREEFRREHGGR
jgi:hypothetical protein